MLSGQSANDITVSAGGTAQIDAGATVSGGQDEGFYLLLGTATSLTIDSGGEVDVLSGGTDVSATIDSGGVEVVSAGGTTISATLIGVNAANLSAEMVVSAGGSAVGLTVGSGGADFVFGTASNTTVFSARG